MYKSITGWQHEYGINLTHFTFNTVHIFYLQLQQDALSKGSPGGGSQLNSDAEN